MKGTIAAMRHSAEETSLPKLRLSDSIRCTMTRTINLELKDFPSTPPSLIDSANGKPLKLLSFDVKTLLHHFYIAKYGEVYNDPAVFEYERFIASGPDWRFLGSGIGRDKEAKRNVSNELGKGFARWFLYTYLGHTYFCPFDDVLERKNGDGSRWTRKAAGNLPDYVCGRDKKDVNLLEAKGRYHSVTFKTTEFDEFRSQIARAELRDASDSPIQVKGFISVARWATEASPRVSAKLLVEDPSTKGRPVGEAGYPAEIGLSLVAGHYAPIFARLQLPVHADAIRTLQPVAERTGARRGIWLCQAGPLKGRRFVGGILPSSHGAAWWPLLDWEVIHETDPSLNDRHASPWILTPPARFFGVEERVALQVLRVIREGLDAAADIESVIVPETHGSLTMLRDGTVLGPAIYFRPADILEL